MSAENSSFTHQKHSTHFSTTKKNESKTKILSVFSSAPAGQSSAQPPRPSRLPNLASYPSERRFRTLCTPPLPAMPPPLLSPLPALLLRYSRRRHAGCHRLTGAGTSAIGVQRGRGDRGAACGRRSKRVRGAAIRGPGSGGQLGRGQRQCEVWGVGRTRYRS
jgi:hypothetical protein